MLPAGGLAIAEVKHMEHYLGRATIIHHNIAVAQFCEAYFRDRHYYSLCCAYPADALGTMLQTSFGNLDLLLVDAETACHKGLELLARLQAHRPGFPILLWVLPDKVEVIEQAFEAILRENPSGSEEQFETESEYVR